MKFRVGQSGNPKGRPKGSVGGRMAVVAALDRLVGERRNVARLERELQKEFDASPGDFLRRYVMPLLPREARLEVHRDGVVQWKSLLGDDPGESPRFDERGLPLPEGGGGEAASGTGDQ